MRLGIWCPAPLSMRPTGEMKGAYARLTQNGGGPGPDEVYAFARDTLLRAEEIGFEITLIAQRFLGPDLDSWAVASALAVQTKKIQIMAAVHPGIMDPRITAKLGASIDRLSGGRFCVNIVNGGREHEFDVFGKWIGSSEARYRRMQEFIQVMRGMWVSDDFNYNGEFYQVAHGTVPTKSMRSPHPPIYAASRVDEGMKVVSEECDTWFVNYSRDYHDYEDSLKRVESEVGLMEARVKSLGRKMGYGVNAAIVMAETDAQAQAIADEWLDAAAKDPKLYSASGGLGAGLVGSPRTVIERMRRYMDMGVDLFMLQPFPFREGLEDFAREVLPELRKSHGERVLATA